MLPPPHGGASDSEILDVESTPGGKLSVSPRVSMSATEDDPPSGSSTPKRKFSKFNIGKYNCTINKLLYLLSRIVSSVFSFHLT